MVNYYNIIDLLLVLLILWSSYYSFKNKTYQKTFHYLKIFLLITISAKLASYTGVYLQKLHITKADTYTTLILIGFGINISSFYFSYKYLYKFAGLLLNNNKLRNISAMVISFLEVLILITFSVYLIMQLYFSKKYLYTHISKSYSYPKIERFYKNFLNDEFVNMILSSDTGTNSKEIIIKSFKNSL
ncbi:MAG: hypothetical protein U9Q33_12270 [Campylobacterota bacterium]|nr:hypothetical protein [Campylobacterota bacterium]